MKTNNTLKKKAAEKSVSSGRLLLYRLIIWSLIIFAILSFCFFYRFYLPIVILICIIIWKLAKSNGKNFNDIIIPKSFTDKIKATKIYQIYFVAAWRMPSTVAIMLLTFFPLLWLSTITLDNWLNPVLNLQEMDLYKGTVQKIIKGTRNRPRDYLWLRTTEGKTIKFEFCWTNDTAMYLKKLTPRDEIYVWAQKKWYPPPKIRENYIQQIQHDGYIVDKYDKDRILRLDTSAKKIDVFCASWSLLMLTIVWVKSNNYLLEGKADGE